MYGDLMVRDKTTISIAPVESEEIAGLVEEGRFTSKSDVLRTAFRIMLEERPELKIDIAVNLYKKGKVTIGRATEIASVGREEFKEILNRKGIKIKLTADKDSDKRVKELGEIKK